MIYASIFSIFSDPAHALWKEIAQGVSAAIMAGIKGLISGLIRTIIAMIEHTSPQFAKTHYSPVQPALFNPVWHVMVIVGISVAVLIMFIGVISSILKGETGVLLKQLAFGLIAVMAMASPVPPLVAQAIFSLIRVFSKFILDSALAQAGHTWQWYNRRLPGLRPALVRMQERSTTCIPETQTRQCSRFL